jgi:molecular chaperone DnaK (HSP70)
VPDSLRAVSGGAKRRKHPDPRKKIFATTDHDGRRRHLRDHGEITAVEIGTGRAASIQIEASSGLTQEEIQRLGA